MPYLGSACPKKDGEGKNSGEEAVKHCDLMTLGGGTYAKSGGITLQRSPGKEKQVPLLPLFPLLPLARDDWQLFQMGASGPQHLLRKADRTPQHVPFHPCLEVEEQLGTVRAQRASRLQLWSQPARGPGKGAISDDSRAVLQKKNHEEAEPGVQGCVRVQTKQGQNVGSL